MYKRTSSLNFWQSEYLITSQKPDTIEFGAQQRRETLSASATKTRNPERLQLVFKWNWMVDRKCFPSKMIRTYPLVLSLLSEVGFEDIRRPDGGFYVFAKLPSGVDDMSFASSLIEENVFLLPGTIFGMPGYLRFCALVPKDSPAFAMARNALKKAMATSLVV